MDHCLTEGMIGGNLGRKTESKGRESEMEQKDGVIKIKGKQGTITRIDRTRPKGSEVEGKL